MWFHRSRAGAERAILADGGAETQGAAGVNEGHDTMETGQNSTEQAVRVRLRVLLTGAVGLTLATAAPALAQRTAIRFERVTGLSQSAVNCIHQDRRGFLWIGTEDGLDRYDGYSFTVFRRDPADPGSLTHNFVWAVEEDADGGLWVGTEGGLHRRAPGSRAFTRLSHEEKDPSTVGADFVWALLRDRQGAVWVGTKGGGLSRYDPARRVFTRYRHDPAREDSLPHDDVRALLESRSGAIWVGTLGGGLARLDPSTGRFTRFRHAPKDPSSLPDDEVRSLYEDTGGRLWVGTIKGGLARFVPETGRFVRYANDPARAGSLGRGMIRAIGQDARGTLWVGTDEGLDQWLPGSDAFAPFRHDPARPYSLSDDSVTAVFSDAGGVLWLGTKTGGLNRWNPSSGEFTSYTSEPGAAGGLTNRVITSFAETGDGALWIGTFGGGLNRLDRATGAYRALRAGGRPGDLGDDRVMSLHVDRAGGLWVGTLTAGLHRLAPGATRFERYRSDPADPGSLSNDGVTCMLETADGSLWIGTYGGGLDRFDPGRRRFERFTHDASKPDSLASDTVTALAEDTDGTLWVGTRRGGLDALDRRTGSFRHFRHDDAAPASLATDTVFALVLDQGGALWIGTDGGGLDRWDAADRAAGRAAMRHHTERNGLPNNVVYAVLLDERGFVWASTNRGLARLDPRTLATRTFDTTHGLPADEFNYGAALRTRKGEMLFGGTNGFVSFAPGLLQSNEHVPPVVLTGMSKLNRPVVFDRPVADVSAVEIGWRESFFSFEFAALDFTAPEKNRYAYLLEGFDRDWIDAGGIRRATYTNVSPGTYTFRVRAANDDGVWNRDGLALRVRVVPPPWRTAWAYALYAAALGAALYAWTRAQRRRLDREADYSRRLEREVQERTAELARSNEELQEANRRLEEASLTDSLTGLHNRRFLLTEIESDLALATRQRAVDGSAHAASFLFLMLDLDGFKPLNDTHGHRAGDEALRQVTAILREACRRSDVIIRWGGDEFLVLGRQTDRLGGDVLARRIRAAIAEHPFRIEGLAPQRLTCSIGFALFPFVAQDPAAVGWEQVLTVADRALYAAKASGRDAWVGIEAGPSAAGSDVLSALADDPDDAVARGLVTVHSSLEKGRRLLWRAED
jgi:diguanylate cyclase (GGDEF)-like protein